MRVRAGGSIYLCAVLLGGCAIGKDNLFVNDDASVEDAVLPDADAVLPDADAGGADAGAPLMWTCPQELEVEVLTKDEGSMVEAPLEVAVVGDWAWTLRGQTSATALFSIYHRKERLHVWSVDFDPSGGVPQLAPHGGDRVTLLTPKALQQSSRIVHTHIQTDDKLIPGEIELRGDQVLSDAVRTPDALLVAATSTISGGQIIRIGDDESKDTVDLDTPVGLIKNFSRIFLFPASPNLWAFTVDKENLLYHPFYFQLFLEDGTFITAQPEFCLEPPSRHDIVVIDADRYWAAYRCGTRALLRSFSRRLTGKEFQVEINRNYFVQIATEGKTVALLETTPDGAQVMFLDRHSGAELSPRMALDPERPVDGTLIAVDLAGSMSADGLSSEWYAIFVYETDEVAHTGQVNLVHFRGCEYK